MGEAEQSAETPQGKALFKELLWVHGMLRRDLETVRGLAADARDGRPAEEIRDGVQDLQTGRPIWQLKVNCLHYCRFVEGHHGLEDSALFPALRQTEPSAGPVIDRLESEHREVATRLDAVEEAVKALGDEDEDGEGRARVAAELDRLADLLLAHLDWEEANAGPVMRRLKP